MIRILRSVDEYLDQAFKVLIEIAVGVQTLVVAAQIVYRYFLRSPLVWGEELARYLLVFISFFGGAVAMKAGVLANVDLLVNWLPGKLRKVVILAAQLSIILFLLVVTLYGYKLAVSPSALKQLSPAMRLPMYWVYAMIPVAGVVMILHAVVATYDSLTGKEPVRE